MRGLTPTGLDAKTEFTHRHALCTNIDFDHPDVYRRISIPICFSFFKRCGSVWIQLKSIEGNTGRSQAD
jgi:hypothetical protein